MGRGFGITAAVDHGVVEKLAREAEALGYGSFWSNDIPNLSGLATLAAAARSTERIKLGVGVIPLDRRPPDVIVDEIRSRELPVDRLVLGVGSGGNSDAMARTREGLAGLDDTTGASVVVGALGPKMAELAGERSDGALLNWMTPEQAAVVAGWVRDGAALAPRSDSLVMSYVRCGFLPAAEPRLREEVARYANNSAFALHEQRQGVTAYDSCLLRHDAADIQAELARYEQVLDETIVRAVTPTDAIEDLLLLLRACAPG